MNTIKFLMMKNKPSILAVIPARGGSKRLPRKNVLPLCGKPLISWSIEAAKNSKYIDDIIVTSDDKEILKIAKQHNIISQKRPTKLASDTATSFDTVKHVLENNKKYDYFILLQPTSPLRTTKHIDEAIELLLQKKANNVISMCEVEHPVQWNTKLDKNHCLDKFIKNINTKQSQEQDVHYRLNGAIYIIKTKVFLKEKSFFSKKKSFAYLMSQESSIDIDHQLDFDIAKIVLKRTN